MTYLKCEVCGHFVSFKDIEEGRASHFMVTPDSDRSREEWETLCAKCNAHNVEKVA